MKVIFLDIDGVMNSQIFYRERHKRLDTRLSRFYYKSLSKIKWILNGFKHVYKSGLDYKFPDTIYDFKYQFKRLKEETCPQKWEWLSEFCNENDVKICISSVWKNHFGDRIKTKPGSWEDALVKLGFNKDTFVGITPGRKTLRGSEIQDWLNAHPNVEDYVILDDDSDMLEHQFKKFHHCDPWFGMGPNHLYRIKRQFNNKGVNYKKLSENLQ